MLNPDALRIHSRRIIVLHLNVKFVGFHDTY